MTLLWRFFHRFLRYRGALLAGFLCIPLAQLADVWVTLLVGDALDRAKAGPDASFMPKVLALLVAAALGHGVFRFYQRWWIVVVSRRVEVDLKQELFDRLTHLDFTFHDRSRSGDVVSRLNGGEGASVTELQTPFGGGKTHALLTLYHLINSPVKSLAVPGVRQALGFRRRALLYSLLEGTLSAVAVV